VSEYDPSDYGRQVGRDYDRLYASIPDTDQAVERLAELAAGGPVLEFGVGTGRLALPLAAQGLAVHGIDASDEMVAVLREKPGGGDIAVTMGDYASTTVEGSFSLVVAPLNSVLARSASSRMRCATSRPGAS
jgi:2-polyprenyl-3-methyl-5-hydroxy-6-metoxy-1,4-benzoquinol methylase